VIGLAIVAAGFLVISRAVVVPILYGLGLGLRTSLVPAINLAQMSEFSIVLASIGLARGQVPPTIVGALILVFAITSVTSTYLINANHDVQAALSRGLRRLGVRDVESMPEPDGERRERPIVFLGFFRDASSMLWELEGHQRGRRLLKRVLVIDFNPNVIAELRRREIACIYGDISHSSTLHHAGIEDASVVISTIPDDILRGTSNLRLLKNARQVAPHAAVILTTEHFAHALELYEEGADLVYVPRIQSARELALLVMRGLKEGFGEMRLEHLAHLRERVEVLA
jgi:hypothetical protein